MKKILLIGRTASGKTTLSQALNHLSKEYKKTQAIEYHDNLIDTPGEYIENRRFYHVLIVSAVDSDMIGLVQDCTDDGCIFPPQFASIFNKPVIGIITKIDCDQSNIAWAEECLKQAGAEKIFKTSAVDGRGVGDIREMLL